MSMNNSRLMSMGAAIVSTVLMVSAARSAPPSVGEIEAVNGKPNFPRQDCEPFIRNILSGKERLRGAMILISPYPNGDFELAAKDLRRLKAYGANHVRLYFAPRTGLLPAEIKEYKGYFKGSRCWYDCPEWYEVTGEIFKKRWIPLFRELDLPIILMMSCTMPREIYLKPEAKLWQDQAEQRRLIDAVVGMADFFKDEEMIIGYDLINEPVVPGGTSEALMRDGYKLWWTYSDEKARKTAPNGDKVLADIYNDMIARIRAFCPDKILVLEPGPYGTGAGFPALHRVKDDPRLVFEMHLYVPHRFVMYGEESWDTGDLSIMARQKQEHFDTYPNAEIKWDKGMIKAGFQEAIEFRKEREKTTGRPCILWIGEFGSMRLAPRESQVRWFTDALDVMEELRLGWAYFVYEAGVQTRWACFTQDGPVGAEIDLPTFIGLQNRRDPNDLSYLQGLRNRGLRPGFQNLADCMKQNQREP